MDAWKIFLYIGLLGFPLWSFEQKMDSISHTTKLSMICDPVSGICEIPVDSIADSSSSYHQLKITLWYFTDPICSSCWGLEPALRKLKLTYGDQIQIIYHMGGLLPNWEVYNSGGISRPADVAAHWDEVSKYYDMPIDGDVWLEDPLPSSFPPSIAFKAAQIQDEKKALHFLRLLREAVFLKKMNICKWQLIKPIASQSGLDTTKLKTDMEGSAKVLFELDLKTASSYGVRGFPSVFFFDSSGKRQLIYGAKSFEFFEKQLLLAAPSLQKITYQKTGLDLFQYYSSYTVKEYAELSEIDREAAELLLEQFFKKGLLNRIETKNGHLYLIH